MLRKLAVIAAATSMVIFSTAAQAGNASALSLANAPMGTAHVRAATLTTAQPDEDRRKRRTILFVLLGVVVIFGVLEVAGVTHIFGEDSPDSP